MPKGGKQPGAGAPPAAKDITDLAQQKRIVGDVNAYLRLKRRQLNQWGKIQLDEPSTLKVRRNDAPTVQVFKMLANELRGCDDTRHRSALLGNMTKLAIQTETGAGRHYNELLKMALEAKKMELAQKSGEAGKALEHMSREELIELLMEEDGLKREAATAIVDADYDIVE